MADFEWHNNFNCDTNRAEFTGSWISHPGNDTYQPKMTIPSQIPPAPDMFCYNTPSLQLNNPNYFLDDVLSQYQAHTEQVSSLSDSYNLPSNYPFEYSDYSLQSLPMKTDPYDSDMKYSHYEGLEMSSAADSNTILSPPFTQSPQSPPDLTPMLASPVATLDPSQISQITQIPQKVPSLFCHSPTTKKRELPDDLIQALSPSLSPKRPAKRAKLASKKCSDPKPKAGPKAAKHNACGGGCIHSDAVMNSLSPEVSSLLCQLKPTKPAQEMVIKDNSRWQANGRILPRYAEELIQNETRILELFKPKKGPIRCHHCTVLFENYLDLAIHFDTHQISRIPGCADDTCISFVIGFASSSERSRHAKSQHSNQTSICTYPDCNYHCPRMDGLKRHYKAVHDMQVTTKHVTNNVISLDLLPSRYKAIKRQRKTPHILPLNKFGDMNSEHHGNGYMVASAVGGSL